LTLFGLERGRKKRKGEKKKKRRGKVSPDLSHLGYLANHI
jgi:hypothetical protein